MNSAVILYGPPASGKDTITAELVRLDSRYQPFRRLKIGSGKVEGYRVADRADLTELHANNSVLYENHRYGNTYVVDEPHLTAMLAAGQIPVIHLGQIAGIHAVTRYPARWVPVLLWCARQSTASRVALRGSSDIDARLAVWDETAEDVRQASDTDFLACIDTDATSAVAAAKVIHSWLDAGVVPIGTEHSRRTTDDRDL